MVSIACLALLVSQAFLGLAFLRPSKPSLRWRTKSVSMIFDFIKQRSIEGFQQVQCKNDVPPTSSFFQVSNIAEKIGEGKIGEAFQGSAEYIKQRQRVL